MPLGCRGRGLRELRGWRVARAAGHDTTGRSVATSVERRAIDHVVHLVFVHVLGIYIDIDIYILKKKLDGAN